MEQDGKTQQLKAIKGSPKSGKAKKIESAKKKSSKGAKEAAVDAWERSSQYLREVAFELRKVVWPSRKETLGSTAVVLVVVCLAGIFLGVVDVILSRLVRLLVG